MTALKIRPGDQTRIMAILNVTPDSFHDGGRFIHPEQAIKQAKRLVAEGADILDIGGESSRPGSKPVEVVEEIRRVIPVIEAIRSEVMIPISVDTTKAMVAAKAIDAGADWINDISAGLIDPDILKVVADRAVPYVAMHMRGKPGTMQKNTSYHDIFEEINRYFEERLEAFIKAGITLDKLILDPGIGFGKSLEDNFRLIANLKRFSYHGCPILMGPSRKKFLSLAGGLETVDRLPASTAVVAFCAYNGADIVRVHDVAEAKQAISIGKFMKSTSVEKIHD
ncbi:dihydropteroate synthase [bacterium]|nr:dihydropteroate synthase [bacterium]